MRESMHAAALLVAVLVGNYLYYSLPIAERPDAAYVGQGVEAGLLYIVVLALVLSVVQHWRVRFVASFMCLWGALEAFQRAFCGWVQWGKDSGGADLCRAGDGPDVYPAIAALSLAVAISLWGVRRG